MGPRRLIALALLAACGGGTTAASTTPAPGAGTAAPPAPSQAATIEERVVADFEAATLHSKDAYVALFDFAAVGEMEILLHRYDVNGRLKNLTPELFGIFMAEDGTPFPPERERRNVGNFYPYLAQRTVGTGGCRPRPPRTQYASLLATFEPLPEGTPPKFQVLWEHATAWTKPGNGGVVAFACRGGEGGLAVVWTKKPNARGYDLITIYDD